MKAYREHPPWVHAVQWTGENKDELNAWFKKYGSSRLWWSIEDEPYVKLGDEGKLWRIPEKDWVLYDAKGLHVEYDYIFRARYEEVELPDA